MTQPKTRREFLKTALASSAALSAGLRPAPPLQAADDRPSVVDTHLHCFAGNDDARFLYHPRAPYRPEQPATPEHLLHCMDGAGVDYAVVVHPEPYQDDHRYLEHCLRVGGKRLKGTCLFFADQPGWETKMPALAEKLDLVTARIHAYSPDRLPPFGTPELRAFWKRIGELGLAVQLHFEPRYAPGFEPLIKQFPATTVIIDHLGRPLQGTPEEHAVVVRWADYKNTVIKLSSLPETANYPHREIAPVIRQLAEAYGADRMIYGGGFAAAATPESYRAYRERSRALISHLPSGDQAKILGGTAARLFRFA
jgi:predicted TIM-barrel fold metal-dependent hydrolase